ncbi:hypothetical protein TIFTF001_039231 [Ficus carica]|uniref:Ankyrin repeat protein n=1 Tax=Ficus carica TaxID=3494 RepID=A0AA88EE30_FICCA|nr:hypothetical protein TIFTF001_039231 [Ficus carica]
MSEWWSYSSRKRKHYPATSRGRRDVAKDMMRTSNKEKDTALHEAVRFNHLGVVKILSKVDPMKQARDSALLGCQERIPRMVTAILDNYSSPAYGGPNGRTALHAATLAGDERIIYRKIMLGGLSLLPSIIVD